MNGPERLRLLPQSEKSAYERRREFHFQAIVQSHLLESMVESLEEAEFEPEHVQGLAFALAQLPEEDQKTVLALPYELRHRLFTKYHEEIKRGSLTPESMVQDLLEKNRKRGFTLGYHLSSKSIPKMHRPDGTLSWTIIGTEIDDRDNNPETTNNNLRMAYYSEDYLSRYKKKPGNYLYVVRAEIGENSTHKRDLNSHWGRAPSLSVISELDMREVEQEIDSAIKKEDAAAGGAGAS